MQWISLALVVGLSLPPRPQPPQSPVARRQVTKTSPQAKPVRGGGPLGVRGVLEAQAKKPVLRKSAQPQKTPMKKVGEATSKKVGKVAVPAVVSNHPTSRPLIRDKPPAVVKVAGKKEEKEEKLWLPRSLDLSVSTSTLSNGVRVWCQQKSGWAMTKVIVAIAGGTASDPLQLHGQARFLSALLEARLNQPSNPARSLFPPGGGHYNVRLQKEWLFVEGRFMAERVSEALKHIAESLRELPPEQLPSKLKEGLARAAGEYPPAGLDEKVEAHLYGGQSRGVYLRGRKQTFQTIQPFALRSAHQKLFRAQGIRVLILGNQDCGVFGKDLEGSFGKISQAESSRLEKRSRALGSLPSVKRKRLLFRKQQLCLYQLPALAHGDVLPLQFVHAVAREELRRALRGLFGREIPLRSLLKLRKKGGYILFAMPSHASNEKILRKACEGAIGQLLMDPYPPGLEGRIEVYRRKMKEELLTSTESTSASASWLLPQLLLASVKEGPFEGLPALKALQPGVFRKFARRFLVKSPAFSGTVRPFSFRSISTMIIALLMLWFFIDLLTRRSRKYDE